MGFGLLLRFCILVFRLVKRCYFFFCFILEFFGGLLCVCWFDFYIEIRIEEGWVCDFMLILGRILKLIIKYLV